MLFHMLSTMKFDLYLLCVWFYSEIRSIILLWYKNMFPYLTLCFATI